MPIRKRKPKGIVVHNGEVKLRKSRKKSCSFARISARGLMLSSNAFLAKEYQLSGKNTIPVEAVHMGSAKRVWWKCSSPDCGYEWQGAINDRFYCQNRRCPVCAGRRIPLERDNLLLGGVNLVKEYVAPDDLSAPEFARNTRPANEVALKESRVLVWWHCSVPGCGYYWQAPAGSRRLGHCHCPRCAGGVIMPSDSDKLVVRFPELAKFYASSSQNQIPVELVLVSAESRSRRQIHWFCDECGHYWRESLWELVRRRTCPKIFSCLKKHSKRLTSFD
ncbi:MAG: zinc-ribbon domain-containing protein [bacterium]